MKFFYERYISGNDVVYYPTINITIINTDTEGVVPVYKVLVDSGASACVFHAPIGETLGINVASGKQVPLRGVTEGAGRQFLHKVVIDIQGNKFEVEAGFSYDLQMPFGLLGQKDFFEKCRVCFDLPKREFEITPKIRLKL